MQKTILITLLLLSISMNIAALSPVDSPFHNNPVWKKRQLTKTELNQAQHFFQTRLDQAVYNMAHKIPQWNG